MSLARKHEFTKGSGNGLQPHALFLSSPDGAPLPSNTGGAGEDIMSLEEDAKRTIVCGICATRENLKQRYQVEIEVCCSCAERVANLYCYQHSGHFLTWSDPTRKAKPPTRKHLTAGTRLEVWKRDGFKCLRCGADSELTVDHIRPLSKGGNDGMENYQTLCLRCNLKKGAKLVEAA